MSKAVAFTGYRASKLPENIDPIRASLQAEILKAIGEGFDTFLCGMADGFDLMAGKCVAALKAQYNIQLIAVVPFEDGRAKSEEYRAVQQAADDEIILSTTYLSSTYYKRNEYLVDHADRIICYYDGKYGGTEYTVEYAQKKGKDIVNLAPNDTLQVKTFDNVQSRVRDDLERTILKKSKLSIAAACFSIYAYQELKRRLTSIDELRFIFTSPAFTTDKVSKEKREFYIPRLAREKSLYGTEFEVRLRNEMTQKAIAKECAEWIRKKVTFKSNISNQNMGGFINVETPINGFTYTPVNGFTTVDIGCEKGNNAYNIVNRLSSNIATQYLDTFNDLWESEDKLEDVTAQVIESISTVYQENAPEFIYFVTLYNIFNEFLEDISEDVLPNEAIGYKNTKIWNTLYSFQQTAVLGIINKLEKYNGCILADSVGLGKTYTALAVIKYYEKRNKDVLVLCPKKLEANWNSYQRKYINNPFREDRFDYDVLYHTDISRTHGYSNGQDLEALDWGNYGLVVIDESHNFRNGTKGSDDEHQNRYAKLLSRIIRPGVNTKVLMLSATPVNNRFTDLKNQIALAYDGKEDEFNGALSTKRNVEDIFKQAQMAYNAWEKLDAEHRTTDALIHSLDFDFFELLDSVTIARSRKHIEKYYNMEEIGKFPMRLPPKPIRAPLTDLTNTIQFNGIFRDLNSLNLSIYMPMSYVLPSKLPKYSKLYDTENLRQLDRENGLNVLMRTNLLKRLESSVYSFNLTVGKIAAQIEAMIATIDDYQNGTKELSLDDFSDMDFDIEDGNLDNIIGNKVKIDLADMDYVTWKGHLLLDLDTLHQLQAEMSIITPAHDAKLQKLMDIIRDKQANPINAGNKKVLIFSAFADTVDYLYTHIAPMVQKEFGLHVAKVSGGANNRSTLENGRTEVNDILTLFSPISKNKELLMPNETRGIDILIGTDCISEGQNLQDCDIMINFDIHWNPVRIVQRFGRIDRIGSKNDTIRMINFWPDITLDEYINLKARVENRMRITNIAGTGDDNTLDANDTEADYRKRQLEKLRTEVVDLEEMSGGISIMDLGLNEFRMDLLEYIKQNPHLDRAPYGLHAVVQGETNGVVFVLKNINKDVNIENKNRLHPFYMVYISEQGEVISNYLNAKHTLDILRGMTKAQRQANQALCKQFNDETNDGKNMSTVSALLEGAIASIVEVKEENDLLSLFEAGGTSLGENKVNGLDDFELITFFVVRS